MYYILLDLALKLGEKNITYLKLDDMKQITSGEKREISENKKKLQEKEEEILSGEIFQDSDVTADLPNTNESFFNTDEFVNPYVENENFAELLPEDDKGNAIDTGENQGPTFLDSVKNKLIDMTEGGKQQKEETPPEEQGPSFLESMKNKLFTQKEEKEEKKIEEKKEKNVEDENKTNILDTVKDTTMKVASDIAEGSKKTKDIVTDATIAAKDATGEKISNATDNIKGKVSDLTEKIKSLNIKDVISGKSDDVGLKIEGTLSSSELEQALNTEVVITKEEDKLLEKENYLSITNMQYIEDEAYKRFLEQRKQQNFSLPEKITVPNIRPREKELISYRMEVPEDLIASRSHQNRHIPKMVTLRENENALEKIIEYGMLMELKAYINYFGNFNYIMKNKHTLLTYATKYKQYKLMQYLIHIGADINKQNLIYETPLMVAIKNKDLNAILLLVEAKANLDVVDNFGRTPLIYCIEKNLQSIGVILIKSGANVNVKNIIGEETLSMATRYGRGMIRQAILEKLIEEKNEKKNKN